MSQTKDRWDQYRDSWVEINGAVELRCDVIAVCMFCAFQILFTMNLIQQYKTNEKYWNMVFPTMQLCHRFVYSYRETQKKNQFCFLIRREAWNGIINRK